MRLHHNRYGALECDERKCPCHWAYGYHEVTLHHVADLAADIYTLEDGNSAPLKQERTGPRGKWRENRPLTVSELHSETQFWTYRTIPETGRKVSTRNSKDWE